MGTQILKEKEKLYKDLDTSARVNVFQNGLLIQARNSLQTHTSQRYKHCDRSKTNGLPYITAIPISEPQELLPDIQDRYYNKIALTHYKNIIDTYAKIK